MRRLYYLLAVIAIMVAASLIYNHVRKDRWRPLPGGGQVRLLAVTYEKSPHFKTRGQMSKAVLALYRGRWPLALGSPPLTLDPSYSRPALAFCLVTRDVEEYKVWLQTNFSLIFGDAQLRSLQTKTSFNSADPNKLVLAAVDFPFAPHGPSRLRLRIERNGQSLDFEVANPCYDPHFAEWQAEPLPQTRKLGNMEITLRDFHVDVARNRGGRLTLKPEFSFRLSGAPDTKPFSHQDTITNSYGEEIKDWTGYSHPVWNIQCKVSPYGLEPTDDPNVVSVDFLVKPPPAREIE